MEHTLRRRTDDSLLKIVKLWPILAAVGTLIATLVGMGYRVERTISTVSQHEMRLQFVEFNAAAARMNTDVLVAELLDEKAKRRLKIQTDNLSAYIFREGKQGEGDK